MAKDFRRTGKSCVIGVRYWRVYLEILGLLPSLKLQNALGMMDLGWGDSKLARLGRPTVGMPRLDCRRWSCSAGRRTQRNDSAGFVQFQIMTLLLKQQWICAA